MAKNNKIRIGVMGCANIAQRSFIPAIKTLSKEFELVAISSRSMDKAKIYADKFRCKAIQGYDNLLLERVDAVYLPLPTGLHHTWVIEALNSGKHVIAEKSLALSLIAAQEMVSLAKKNKLLLMEDFMFRYHSQHKFVFEQINKGVIGEIRLIRSNFGFPPLPAENFRYDMALGGGALFDAGAYTIKASSWFLGDTSHVIDANLHFDNKGTVIHGSASMQNAQGLVSQVGFGFDNFYQCNYEIWGSKGKIMVTRAFTPGPAYKPTIIVDGPGGSLTHEMDPDDHFKGILKEFHRAILEKDLNQHYNDTMLQAKLIDECKQLANLKAYNNS